MVLYTHLIVSLYSLFEFPHFSAGWAFFLFGFFFDQFGFFFGPFCSPFVSVAVFVTVFVAVSVAAVGTILSTMYSCRTLQNDVQYTKMVPILAVRSHAIMVVVNGPNSRLKLKLSLHDVFLSGLSSTQLAQLVSMRRAWSCFFALPFGFVKSRVVTDSNTEHVVETLVPSLTTRPEQPHRNFKSARSVQVVMEVYGNSGEESIAWEDQEMLPDDQTRYRALSARLNFLAVDRPDLLYAAKECSRRMSKPRNKDWEALKRICRYLIGCP